MSLHYCAIICPPFMDFSKTVTRLIESVEVHSGIDCELSTGNKTACVTYWWSAVCVWLGVWFCNYRIPQGLRGEWKPR